MQSRSVAATLLVLVAAACAPSPYYTGGDGSTGGEAPRDARGEPLWAAIKPPPPPPAPPPEIVVNPGPPIQPAPVAGGAPGIAVAGQPGSGPFIIFFDFGSSVISTEAAAILDRAVASWTSAGWASVSIAGHADRAGSDSINQALSAERAEAVRAYFLARGVPAQAIATAALGESRPLVDTADGVREPQNRRVEINFASPAPAAG